MTNLRDEAGFSLLELLVATGVLLVVSSIVTDALMQMTTSQKTIWNRTEMHSGIRGATELLQQEVGQAGRVSLPAPVAVGAGGITIFSSPCTTPSTVTLSPSTSGIFPGEILTILDGDTQESVAVTAIPSSTAITACFTRPHGVGASILPLGGFATGIVPNTGIANPSTATVLKMYGDINGDGRMVYVEYVCDTAARKLYRHAMDFDATPPSPAPNESDILLGNVIPNPGNTPCFAYQTSTIDIQGTPYTFVLDVAITLTVETEQIDPVTRQKQTETEALLNVSPRNVFNAWSYAGMGYTDRIQPTPQSVQNLLP